MGSSHICVYQQTVSKLIVWILKIKETVREERLLAFSKDFLQRKLLTHTYLCQLLRESEVLWFRCVPGMLELCRFLMVEVIFLITLTFHMTERKGAAPDPFQQGCLVPLRAYLPGKGLSEMFGRQSCAWSLAQAEGGSLMPSMQVWTVGFRSAGDVIQHWCLAVPCVKWGLTGAVGGSQATALGSCTPLQVRAIPGWAERNGSHSPEPLNRLLSRSHTPSPVPHSTNVSQGWLAALLP